MFLAGVLEGTRPDGVIVVKLRSQAGHSYRGYVENESPETLGGGQPCVLKLGISFPHRAANATKVEHDMVSACHSV